MSLILRLVIQSSNVGYSSDSEILGETKVQRKRIYNFNVKFGNCHGPDHYCNQSLEIILEQKNLALF